MSGPVDVAALSHAIDRLIVARDCGDAEAAHGDADRALCDLLVHLGYGEAVAIWEEVDKWYA